MKKWLFLLLGLGIASAAAQVRPAQIWGLIYTSSTPTLTNGQGTFLRSNSSGQFRTTGLSGGGCDGTINLNGCIQPILVGGI